jgi:hypothetical protein
VAYRSGTTVLFITYDEDDHHEDNRVYTVVVAPSVSPGTVVGDPLHHYSLLRTQEELLSLPPLGQATSAASMRAAFGSTDARVGGTRAECPKTSVLPCRPDMESSSSSRKSPLWRRTMRARSAAASRSARDIEADKHIVSWAIGHLVELAEPEYDEALKRWSIKTLPVLPEQFKPGPTPGTKAARRPEAADQRDDVGEIVNGCDASRQGELIFRYIMTWRGPRPVRRLWVSSMTKDAIRDGFENLRPGEEMEPLAAAARSRSEADWLVGMNATRAATVKGRSLGGVVSLGRVQTPTLALIVRRDLEIDAFEPQTYFQVDARFGLDGRGRTSAAGRGQGGPHLRARGRRRRGRRRGRR